MANRYARIDSGVVAEVVELPTGIKPADAFHASIASQFRICSAEVMAGWLFDGETYSPPEIGEIVTITVLPAVTLWERMTVEEAIQVETAMATQPFRTRQIFLTANTFRSDHELWPLLVQMATDLFGETRADELLAAE